MIDFKRNACERLITVLISKKDYKFSFRSVFEADFGLNL